MSNLKFLRHFGIVFTMLILGSIPLEAAQTPNQDTPAVQLCQTGFSPDGKTITSSTDDGHVRLWNMETAALLHDFVMNKGCVYAAFTADSQRLFTSWLGSDMSGKDAATTLWDLQTGEEIRRFKGKTVISDDGQMVLMVSKLPQELWDVPSGSLVRTFSESLHALPGGFFSTDKQRFISNNFPESKAELWDMKTGSLLFTFPQQNAGWISLIRFLPDNQHVLIGNDNNNVALWDLNTLSIEQTFENTANGARFHFYSSGDHFYMVSLEPDGTVRVWDALTGDLERSFPTGIPREYISDSTVSSDGKLLFIGLYGGLSQIWNMETGSLARQFFPPANSNITQWNDTRTFVKFSPDNGQALIGYSNETVHLWDFRTWAERVYRSVSK